MLKSLRARVLVLAISSYMLTQSYAWAQKPREHYTPVQSSVWHMESVPVKRVSGIARASLIPLSKNDICVVYAPRIPVTTSQDNVQVIAELSGEPGTIGLTGGHESSPVQRMMMQGIRTPGYDTLQLTFSTTLYTRKLVAGRSKTSVLPLTPEERAIALRESEHINFRSKEVQDFIAINRVIRSRGQSDLQFAYYVLDLLRQQFTYGLVDGWRFASNTCKTKRSECSGLSALYVALLRANDIPARTLTGHILPGSNSNEKPATHTRCEFYASNIGWVPVEVSSAVSFKNVPLSNYFGNDQADLLIEHIDSDIKLPGLVGFMACPALNTNGIYTFPVYEMEIKTEDIQPNSQKEE